VTAPTITARSSRSSRSALPATLSVRLDAAVAENSTTRWHQSRIERAIVIYIKRPQNPRIATRNWDVTHLGAAATLIDLGHTRIRLHSDTRLVDHLSAFGILANQHLPSHQVGVAQA
jgi:hypothetical protein